MQKTTQTPVVRMMRPHEAGAVCALIAEVFDEFVAPEYCAAGAAHFHTFVQPDVLHGRIADGGMVFVAYMGDELAGIIEMRACEHVVMLFTAARWQRRGIARRLLDAAVEECRALNGTVRRLTVNSSPNAVPVYARLGFIADGPEQERDGIRHTPMTKLCDADAPPAV
ncbi:GNAT family N-acetyltransferase [Oleidesulfovibrio alaskensis]|jgi:GNAT superfamily N-acetyltransferase|uniref:GNAT family N-acetyltransferase n=1 Tax=Oleidesulfovibrio alaskensis TaxID=58180 RepID=UPI001A493670|nr:GNAT family N-acetyltransferase [Oleidesulfovibrio alaskensis]MBL3581341.1 GNAT family N-acetyltransferase [Oleidesulfovibrio alaskensis]